VQDSLNTEGRIKKLLKLFITTFYISAFTFGGGFVIVTFMKRKFVDELHWIDEQEMLDMTALAQTCPGPIAVNAAILVGWRVGGFLGMLTGVIGTILPPMIVLSVISFFYAAFASNRYVALVLSGMQAGVAAVIFDVVCSMALKMLKGRNALHALIMAAAFIATFFMKINVIFILIAAGVVGIVHGLRLRGKGDKA
jgi:chromate transporter